MSSSTALLPKDRKNNDHPIFLRVCHSPWVSADQKTLVALRFITSVYLTCSFAMIVNFEINHNEHGWLTAFEFANIAYFLQMLYSWIAFSWTFMHLHYPHHGSQSQTNSTRLQKFFSPPRQQQSTDNRTWFSMFYFAVNSFPLVVSSIYWFILVPKNKSTIPGDEIFGHGWFQEFYVISKFVVNCFVAFVEIFIFSSIKRADAVWAHIFGITFLSLLYIGWAYFGFAMTNAFGYYFFDHNIVGWDDATAAIMAFSASTNAVLVVSVGC